METNRRVHVYLSGRVQGVGFRAFTSRTAQQLGVKGWVKNLADGRVEAVLAGSEEKVEQMLNKVKTGPRFAEVNDMQVEEEDYRGEFDKFEVRY